MNNELVIAPYDDRWPTRFNLERGLLCSIFSQAETVFEHIGSTSVPNLGAKPIINIMVGSQSLAEVEECIPALVAHGYQYVPEFESELPNRRYFRKPGWQLHCVIKNSPFWIDHLVFRDCLRSSPVLARDYYQLKISLATKHKRNHRAYTEAKSEFIERVLEQARLNPDDAS